MNTLLYGFIHYPSKHKTELAHDSDLKENNRNENKSENMRMSTWWSKIDLKLSRAIRVPAEKEYDISVFMFV